MTAWAEDWAPWRHDPSADPGTKTEGGRHDAALFSPSGLVRKRQIGPCGINCSLPLIFSNPVSPFHGEPLQ